MHPALNLDLPEPEWIALLRAERQKGKAISQIAREVGMARPSVSMLISGSYPAQSLDLVARKHGAQIVARYRDKILCPYQHRSIGQDDCRALASAPMSTSNPDKMRQQRACRNCALNPIRPENGQ